LALVAALVAGCSGSSPSTSESVFAVRPGQCFIAPKDVHTQLSNLSRVLCKEKHNQEAYARVQFSTGSSANSTGSPYPGTDALETFAKGACAQRFASYVGVDYLDSSLFFTYLLPSARSWEQARDRTILCFITTTGGELTGSVKGSKK
jgi:hypothetical protein